MLMRVARAWPGIFAVFALLPLAAPAAIYAATGGERAPGAVHLNLRYVFTPRHQAPTRQQSLDLYLPPGATGKLPLIAFVHGGFWRESDDSYGIGKALAETLFRSGVAVALVRYPLAPAHKFPAQPEDVARAVAYLHRVAGQYNLDAKRVFLMGHSAGAHLASLVALDGRYLREAGAPPAAVAGVIAVSGIYDLKPTGPLARQARELVVPVFGSDTAAHGAASPAAHARAAPPFLVLSAENDFDGFPIDARRFAARLRASGNRDVQEIVVQGADHFTIFKRLGGASSVLRDLLLSFTGAGSLDPFHAELWAARRKWQEPPLSTEPFWVRRELIKTYRVNDRFLAGFGMIYDAGSRFELGSYPLREFHAIPLARFLDSQPREKIGEGDYLVLTNARREKVYWRLSEIAPYEPVIVIGLDDERNLFRLSTFYRNKLAYSWKDEKPALSVRSLGGFIYFLKPPPPGLVSSTTAMYSLTAESFRRTRQDPLAAMADLPRDVRDAIYFRNACLSCHSFRGTEVRSGHVRARDGEQQGGFALSLESYPPEAWRQFMFDNQKSAAAVGVRPNPVAGPAAQKLHDIVVKERQRR
jgi:acetyl esterase/lipase